MAKRGRPKGSGNSEDEPLIREAYRAYKGGEFRSLRAAATEYSKRLFEGDPEVNRDRLYRKMRDRQEDLEAGLKQEECKSATMEEQAEEIASQLSELPAGVKEERLYRLFLILVENNEVEQQVLERLREQGLDPPPEFLTFLGTIKTKIIKKEQAAFEAGGIARSLRSASERAIRRKERRKS